MKKKKNKDEFAHYKQSTHTTTTTEKAPKIFLNKCNVVKWVEKRGTYKYMSIVSRSSVSKLLEVLFNKL